MTEKQIDIADMQCWLFQMAQDKWKISPQKCNQIFKKYKILDFIEECYDILHLSSYDCALKDIEKLLANKGVKIC